MRARSMSPVGQDTAPGIETSKVQAAELWRLLRCPACGDAPSLEVYEEEAGAPLEGLLRSGCGAWFPITGGIPRIFVGAMRALYGRDFGEFLRRHGLATDTGPRTEPARADGATAMKLRTADSFGYEWNVFNEMRLEWEETARFYFEAVGGTTSLHGLLALGCR